MDSFSGGELGIAETSKSKCGLNLGIEKIEPFKEVNLCFKDANIGETSYAALIPKKGEFHVSDLVWGKVKGYPWWPGQIIKPWTASANAKKRKDSFLIAYFGDESILWTKASKIMPFEKHFSLMSKESSDEDFCEAVDAALEEYSRRIQVGLACPEETLGKAKVQGLTNSGVQELPTHVSSGGGNFVTAFQPGEVVAYLQTLAKSPQAGCDALKLATAKAHLSAFYRSKGYNELPCIGGFYLGEDSDLGDDTEEDDRDQMIDRKRKAALNDVDQHEPLGESKKPRTSSSLQNDENMSEAESQKDPPSHNSHVKKPYEPLGEAEKSQLDFKSRFQGGEEPACSVPVRRGRGRPRKAVVEDFISGSCSKFQNGQKEPACFVEIPEETVEPALRGRGRGRPRKTVVNASESRVSSLTGQKYQEKQETKHRSRESLVQKKERELIDKENKLESREYSIDQVRVFLDEKMKAVVLKEQQIEAQLEERECFLQKRESELMEKGKTLEGRESSIESREQRVEGRENEIDLKQMDLALKQEKFEKWEGDLDAKEIILNSMEFKLRDAEKTVEKRKKKLVASTDKVKKLWLEFNRDDESAFSNQTQGTEKGKRSSEELVGSCDAEMGENSGSLLKRCRISTRNGGDGFGMSSVDVVEDQA